MTSIFPKTQKRVTGSKLVPLTLRGFGGGLDAVTNDIAMQPTFQVTLNNMRRTASAGQKIRFGSNWHADVADTVVGNILDSTYFSDTIVSVTVNGQISATNDNGAKIAIWNNAIAATLPGAPIGWSTGLVSANFVPFKGSLIIHNGIDKPIIIDSELNVDYLQDEGTGSNTNVPIGLYGCVVSNYHCVAGISGFPTTIYVSSVGTSGTFPGDPIPNDSISIDVGAYAPESSREIRGIVGFRSNLLVFFRGQCLIVKLGVYNADGVHTPEFPDTMPQFGLLGHRCVVPVVNDIRFASLGGFGSAKRNLTSGLVDTTPISDIIEPLYKQAVGELTDNELLFESFMVEDALAHETLLFLPDGSIFVYSANEKLRYKGWSIYSGIEATWACVSFKGRVYYGAGSKIFQHGNNVFTGEAHAADRKGDRDGVWNSNTSYDPDTILYDGTNGKSYICIAAHISGLVSFPQDRIDQTLDPKWEEYLGEGIDFEMETPWLASKDPMQAKQNRYISIATKGAAAFTMEIYVDNLYKDENGVVQYDPALSIDLIGSDAAGFGYDAGPYGGGRRSGDPRLISFPVEFKTAKVRFIGSAKKPLEFVNMSFLFARGRYRR